MLQPRSLQICRVISRLPRKTGTTVYNKRFQTSLATKEDSDQAQPVETIESNHSNDLNTKAPDRTLVSPQQINVNFETFIRQVEKTLSSGRNAGRDSGRTPDLKKISNQSKAAFQSLENALSQGKHPSRSTLKSLLHIAHYSQDERQNALVLSMCEKYWIPLTPEMIEFAGFHLTHKKKFRECLEFFSQQIKASRVVTPIAWETLIDATIRRGEHEVALHILQRIDSFAEKAGSSRSRMSLAIYYDALVAFADQHYLAGIQWVWNRAIRSGELQRLDLGACTKVLNACGRNGLPILATEVMQYISRLGFEPTIYHYASLIESYCVAGDVKNAFMILNIMRKQGKKPTDACAGPIVRFLATDVDLVDRAFFTLQDAHAAGQTIDTVALNAVIDASVLMQDLSRAIATYQEHESLGVNPNLDTLNSLMTGCIGAQNKVLALSLVAAFREKHSIVAGGRTFERLIYVCILQDDYEDAFKYLEEMKEEGHQPSIGVYSLIIRRCVAQRDPRAKIAYEEMKGWGYRHPLVDRLFTGAPDVRRPLVTAASTGTYDRLLTFAESDRWFKPKDQISLKTTEKQEEAQ